MSDSLWSPGILQAKMLEWVAFPFSRGASQPKDGTQVSHIAGGFFTSWAKSSHTCMRLSRLQIQLILFFLYIPLSPSLYQHCFLRLSRLACIAQIDIQLLCLESYNWFFSFSSAEMKELFNCVTPVLAELILVSLSFQLFVIWSHLSFSTLHLIP